MDIKGEYDVREASHAGSWYSANKRELEAELAGYLKNAQKDITTQMRLKGIIGPHAGFYYSGPTAAWAYINIDPSLYRRVILLGPSHHAYLSNCALTKSKYYETPFGNIEIDKETTEELYKGGGFVYMKKDVDEAEHSLEMHIPYIKKMFGDNPFKLVPIMVGNLNQKSEQEYGARLAPYLKDDQTLFVISSDFCHWGSNFDYYRYDKNDGEIWQSVEKMDKQGMSLIEEQNPEGFHEYLQETDNTICGRHPIAVFLNAIKASGMNLKTKFVKYAQSSKAKKKQDSSVSYASSYTYLEL